MSKQCLLLAASLLIASLTGCSEKAIKKLQPVNLNHTPLLLNSDYFQQKFTYNMQDWVVYQEKTKDASELHYDVKAFLEASNDPYEKKTKFELTEMGRSLLKKGSMDPIVRWHLTTAMADIGFIAEAVEHLEDAYNDMSIDRYPARMRFFCCSKLAYLAEQCESIERAADWSDTGFAEWREWASSDRITGNQEIIIDGLIGFAVHNMDIEYKRSNFQACQNEASLHPWTLEVASGMFYRDLAWHHRGGGFANTVSDEGWEMFRKHMDTAGDHFFKAWKAVPTLPTAPAKMIEAAMAYDIDTTPKDWFKRTTDVRFDYWSAYDLYSFSMEPKWGGTAAQMLALGKECANSNRFGTKVPFRLLTQIYLIANATKSDEIYRDVEVNDTVIDMLDRGIEFAQSATGSGPKPHLNSDQIRSIKVGWLLKSEQFEDALDLAKQLGDAMDYKKAQDWGFPDTKPLYIAKMRLAIRLPDAYNEMSKNWVTGMDTKLPLRNDAKRSTKLSPLRRRLQ
ncbi:MAG: hypothetical protein AAF497_09235 [Planctomycetota bacterium]